MLRRDAPLPIVPQQLQSSFDMHVAGVKVGCSLIRVKRIGSLVVTGLVLAMDQKPPRFARDDKARLTKVPRSYQTSEMYGFSLIALE